jgi:ABC-type multidrug transport system ATPase subunit
MPPVLQLSRLRVDEGGRAQVDGLSLETAGERVLLLAGPSALFRAAAGIDKPRHGTLLSFGLPVDEAVRAGLLAGAPCDPPLPPSWRVKEYLEWSARLVGRTKDETAALVESALGRMKLEDAAETRLRSLPLLARRSLSVAAALATGARTVLVEDPMRGLSEEAARTFARLLVRGTAELSLVVFAGRISLSSPLAMDADEALVLEGSTVLAQGAPAEVAARDRSYSVRLHGPLAPFVALAEQRGARVTSRGAAATVDLGASLEVTDLLDVAMSTGTVILELRPVARAFS